MTERQRTVTWTDPMEIAAAGRGAAGVDFLRALADGKLPAPPIALLLGFRPVQIGEGHAVFEYEPDESHYNPIGTVHGGVAASVFDAALGCAVHSKLPAGVGYTTLELHTNFIRPIVRDTPKLRCEATAIHVGRTVGTAEATLKDATGKLYAHATATQLILRP